MRKKIDNFIECSVALVATVLLSACGGGSAEGSAGTGAGPSSIAAPATTTTTTATTTTVASSTTTTLMAPPHFRSSWSAVVDMPIIPVAAANLPDGKVLTWSAYAPDDYGDENAWGRTYSAIFDPVTQTSQSRLVTETGHDMFCPGISLLADGRILINGGSSSQKTTIYNPASNSWNTAPQMNIARGYQGNTTLADGSVLTLGGTWSGGNSAKNGEIWTQSGGWSLKSGIPIAPFIGPDPDGAYRGDNHAWLFTHTNGRVFHAGPSAAMHWIDTAGSGRVTPAGNRGDDVYSMNGSAVMYDIGKILKTGGAQAYEYGAAASSSAYLIDLDSTTVRKIAPMHYARTMHNSVVLPNGQVVIIGGLTQAWLFSDDRAVLMTELWDPSTETFTRLSAMAVPRTYHSVALLLPDGRVLVGGGGLCGSCGVNHPNVQILTPPYLLNADGTAATRPIITSAATSASHGSSITVTTDTVVTSFAMMRLSAVTHSVNNDQRRIPLQSSSVDGRSHILRIPSDAGIALPGYYMLFAFDQNGVPSVSSTIQIR